MRNVTPGEKLNLTVLRNNRIEFVSIVTESAEENQSRAVVGLSYSWASYQPNRLGLDQYSSVNLYWALFWGYALALSVAIFNMLPAFPFDGERVLYYPLASLVKKRKRELRLALSAFAWGLLGLNIALSFLFGLRGI